MNICVLKYSFYGFERFSHLFYDQAQLDVRSSIHLAWQLEYLEYIV